MSLENKPENLNYLLRMRKWFVKTTAKKGLHLCKSAPMPRSPPTRRDGGTPFLGRYKIVQLIFPRRIIQSGYSPLKGLNCKQEETRSCF